MKKKIEKANLKIRVEASNLFTIENNLIGMNKVHVLYRQKK